MSPTTSMIPAMVFSAVFVALYIGHGVGDHWLQTDYQATNKGKAGWIGRLACLRHVLSYTATTAIMVMVVWVKLDLPITPAGFVLGQLVSALTHYWADRRSTLKWLVEHLSPWSTTYYREVPGGAGHLDQTFHWFWLFIAALLAAVIR